MGLKEPISDNFRHFDESAGHCKISFLTYLTTTLSFCILLLVGVLSNIFSPHKMKLERNRKGYPNLVDDFTTFYMLYVLRRIRECYSFIVCSTPGPEIVIRDRITKDNGWTIRPLETTRTCINLGSYNYLGFAQNKGPCMEKAIEAIETYGVSTCTCRSTFCTKIHQELEQLIAEFIGVEDAITYAMGFATNANNIPVFLSPGCLALSDAKNHSSIILGIRLAGASYQIFNHNDMKHLEVLLQQAITKGQDGNDYVPWKKIIIIVEGIYSMDGTICKLPDLIKLKKKYKAYLYVDEAHSIGALGKTGRGVVEHFGCNPKDIDVHMGTFTKSFAAAGGYIAGSRDLIAALKRDSDASKYAVAISPPVVGQVISVLNILMGRDGTNLGKEKIEALARNTKYFRKRLKQTGVVICGNDNSPVVPILTFSHTKTYLTVQRLLDRKVATVAACYPVVPLGQARIRLCLSAVLTKEQLDYTLEQIQAVVDELGLHQ